jgi:hypothetical protein
MSRIDDELEVRFDSATRVFPAPDPADLKRRRRRLELRARAARIGLSVLVVALSLAAVVVARSSIGPDSSDTSPASPDFDPTAYGTYEFTDVSLRRPDPDELAEGVDPRKTFIVEYRSDWSGDQFPGAHACRWSILDREGREIGATDGELTTLGPGGSALRHIQVTIEGSPKDVATAQVACDPARSDTPIAYEISDEIVIGTFKWRDDSDPGVMIGFRVDWPVELPDYPSDNWCTVALYRPGGEQVASQVFTLATGPGPMEHRVWPDEFSEPSAVAEASSLTADVDCEPYTGRQVAPFDRDLAVVSLDLEALLDLTPDEYWDGLPRRLQAWSRRIRMEDMDAGQIASAMDTLTRLIAERPDHAHMYWIHEVMQRRQYLCERLPVDHEYRAGEYCD